MEKQSKRTLGLRRRWMTSSLLPVITILVLISALVSIGLGSAYYSNARSALEAKAAAGAEYFNTYAMTSYEEYYHSATLYANSFEDSDRIELQFLNSNGAVDVSTRSMMIGSAPGTQDVYDALSSGVISSYLGRDNATGERIIAASGLLKFQGEVVGIIRLVTSAHNLDSQVLLTVMIILAIMLAVSFVVVISSLLLINNVVAPVSAVSEAAKQISGGSYGFCIPNRYADEMGELVDNINDMSVKIGQNEKLQQEFISSVSHELRTPLTAINGWAETLLADVGESEEEEAQRRGLNIIVKESSRLTKMVEELLDFSKIADGRFTLDMEPMDLQAEFEDTVYTYHQIFKQEGITLLYTAGDEYDEIISADPVRLKQVFCNVLDNAAKHGGSGKRIVTRLNRSRGHYIITVRDFGPGIPEADLPHVKEKFYKGSSKARGSGIGLAVCDEIIRLHDGTFSIDNAKGGGAIVTIKLPIRHVRRENSQKKQ
ncbi:MAG: HAMP domain-containing histidine kinase [Oscillospiraceae bacterium]|nr:HAMP domain-containing histidine kinase [Oscillospiraceae bacterium]MBP3698458.1 HAMP domain-containing histidine kinase [Oscillospiraceae bacterium]